MPNLTSRETGQLFRVLLFTLLAINSSFASTLIAAPSERIKLLIPNNDHSKVALDRLTCAFSTTGISLDSVILPWQRILLYAENNMGQAFYSGENRVDNIDRLMASAPVMRNKIYWLTRTTIELSAQQQKYEQGVAVTKASHAQQWANAQQQTLFKTKDSDTVLQLVASGRVTRGLLSKKEYHHALSALALSPEDFNIFEAFETSQHVFFSKQFLATQADYLPRFNKGLKTCTEIKRVASTGPKKK